MYPGNEVEGKGCDTAEVDHVTSLSRQIVRLPHDEKQRLFERIARYEQANQAQVKCADERALTGGTALRGLSEEVTLENVDEVMRYQPWMPDQLAAGDVVRETLVAAVRAILRHVPRCPNRTKAINHLIDARMDANAAISFRGRF